MTLNAGENNDSTGQKIFEEQKIALKSMKLTRELGRTYGIKYKKCAGCQKLVPYSFRVLSAAPLIEKLAASNLAAIYADRSYVFDSRGYHALSNIIICPKCRKRNFDHDVPTTKKGMILDARRVASLLSLNMYPRSVAKEMLRKGTREIEGIKLHTH